MRVAIIGGGIAGLGAAWALRDTAEVSLFEKQPRLGGHSHTVRVPSTASGDIAVDTGFIVYNLATYPNLIALFDTLQVPTQASDMSFAVSLNHGAYEYSGDNLRSLVGHWQNAVSPAHWRLIADLVRFMKEGNRLCSAPPEQTLGDFLVAHRYSLSFIDRHLLPMAAAIWSAAPKAILDFPARSFGNFFRNHGLLELNTARRPQWRTVTGGSVAYVERLCAAARARIVSNSGIAAITTGASGPVVTMTDGSTAAFDHVILAAHADDSVSLLPSAHAAVPVLKNFTYSANETWLHNDPALMPRRRRLWASWNYLADGNDRDKPVFVSYWMNRLQNIPPHDPLFVSLNPSQPPRDAAVFRRITYHHPQFTAAAVSAQYRLRSVQGCDNVWFCGSYCGYGFHEDALASGLAVAAALGAPRPWAVTDISPAFANATPQPA